MNPNWSEEELKHLAQQLSCPDGEVGVVTGERMNVSNDNMIKRTLDTLSLKDNEQVAEIGPGNGSHVGDLLSRAKNTTYTGIEVSATMVQAAQKINTASVDSGRAFFVLTDGKTLPFAAASFDKLFTVNTIYFWEEPAQYANEIFRVLKPGGRFYLAFAHRSFMQKLPFTQYGFQLYDPETVERLVSTAQFSVEKTIQEAEHILGNMGEMVERDIVIVVARKNS